MNRGIGLLSSVTFVATLVGCVSAPFNPNTPTAVPSPGASTVATNVASAVAPSPTASVAPKPSPTGTPALKPPASSAAPSPAGSPAPKPPAPAASTAPKAAATPIAYPYKYFYFTYPATWNLVKEVRNPAKLVFEPAVGEAVLSVRELVNTTDLAAQRARVVAEVGIGLVSNADTTLDSNKGFLIIWNRTEDGRSRYHATRGFIYKETYFEIEANWNRPSPEMTAIDADVTAFLKSWLWQ